MREKRERREERERKERGERERRERGVEEGKFNHTAQPLEEIISDQNWFRPELLGSLLALCTLRLNNHCLSILSSLIALFTARCQQRNEQKAGGEAFLHTNSSPVNI